MSRLAKSLGFRVVSNDWEPYAAEINLGYIACNCPPSFTSLGFSGAEQVFRHLNDLESIDGYVSRHLCPREDLTFDPLVDRLFFTRRNGRRIDAMRQQLWDWEQNGLVSATERGFILAALLYAVSYVSNTSGVFKGFHRGWGGSTGTALYRILSDLTLQPPLTFDNGQTNLVTSADAQSLADSLGDVTSTCDIAYLDPPYNQHPYGANYHVLNTVVLWDHPAICPTISGFGDKSAIRRDWRTERRSAYNSRRSATSAFERLLGSIQSRFILISYSTDGLISLESIVGAACRHGSVEVMARTYKRYRVSSQRYSRRGSNVEFVLVVDTRSRSSDTQAEALVATIRSIEVGGVT